MGKKDKQTTLFELQGRFLGFQVEDGYKLKYLRIATADGEYRVKLSKESRASVGGVITPGDWLQIWGEKTIKHELAEPKLKAYKICVSAPGDAPSFTLQKESHKPKAAQPQATVLVCQKLDCMKRGGKAVCKALEAELDDRNLTGQVTIRGTGCMKHCKTGPNLVVMPDKTRYSRISADEIPALLDKHFPAEKEESSQLIEAAGISVPVPI